MPLFSEPRGGYQPVLPIVGVLMGLWFGYWALQAIETGAIRARSHTVTLTTDPITFYVLLASQAAAALAGFALVVRQIQLRFRPWRGKPLTIRSALRGFGVLEPREYDGHTGRNPKTGWEPRPLRAASEAS